MTYYLGQIELFAGNYAPGGCAFCDGQLMPIAQYEALFSLLGTIYGGDGRTTFGLPDLRGRVAIGDGTGPGLSPRSIGQSGGQENVSLISANIPAHSHELKGRDAAPSSSNSGVLAKYNLYAPAAGTRVAMESPTIQSTPPSPAQPHTNMQPYQTLNYIICLIGAYPSRS
jgi:microcystin-dependent protein